MRNFTSSAQVSGRNRFSVKFIGLLLLFVSVIVSEVWGQINISSSSAVTENFDEIGTSATATLPTNWKMSAAGAGNISNWNSSGNVTATNAAASSGSPNTGARYNWATTAGTDRAIGFITSGNYASPNSILAWYNNTSGSQINDLTISFDIERYRVNTSAFSLTFFISTDGITWTSRTSGDIASSVFATGSNAYDFTAATKITKTVTLSSINIANNGNLYLRWVFSTGSSSSQGVALDNVSLTATLAPSNDQTSKVEAPTTQTAAGDIASTVTASGSAVEVFKFKVSDLGSADGLATKITQVKIKKSSGTANWTDHIAGASLWDGASQITTGTVVIMDNDITFPITSGNLDIANSANKEITMKIWLKSTNIVDNSTMVFMVSQTSHDFTADATGSAFATDFGSAVTGNTITVRVAATKVSFTTSPSSTACPNTNLTTSPVVKATDANGTTDVDFIGLVTLTNSGSIGMTNYEVNATAGVASFSTLQFTNTGSVTLTAGASGLTSSDPTATITISVGNATSTAASNGNALSVLTWTNPASCYDEIMIVAKSGSAVVSSPSGDGTAYTANLAYGSGTEFDGGYIVYKGTTSSQTVTGLTNGTTYYFTLFTRKGSIWSSGITTTGTPALASSASDYFRTKTSGNWNSTSTWESSSDNTNWIAATATPTSSANTITILNGHTVSVTSSVTIDQTIITSGGILEANSNVIVNDGSGDDIVIQNGGTLKYSTSSSYAAFGSGSPTISNETGGIILITAGSIIQNLHNSNYVYKNASILEWNSTNAFSFTGITYFPNADASTIPIFRISSSIGPNVGGGTSGIVNGILEANGSVTFGGNSTKTFRNGIRGIGTVTQGTAYQFFISGSTAEIGGGTLSLHTSGGLSINTGTVATLISNKVINNGPIIINGTIDFGTYTLSGTSACTLSSGATLKTANATGVAGSITVSGTKTFNPAANYEFTGSTIGTLPANAGSIVLKNSDEVVVSSNTTATSVTVAPGAKLTLNNGSTFSPGTFVLQSSGSATATFVDARSDENKTYIPATVQQYLPQGRNWYVGIPIVSGSASTLTAAGLSTSVSYWDETAGDWENNYAETLTPGIGYIGVSTPAAGSGTNNVSFTGNLNTGNFPVTVTRTVTAANKPGFNLIANPYPSYLNPCALITGKTKLEPTIWYRTAVWNGTKYVYSFETVNTADGVGTHGVTGYIPPMQAFWVRVLPNTNPAEDNSETLTFTNDMRYHANPTIGEETIATTPLKAKESVSKKVVRLRVSNGITNDEAVLYSNANAQNSFDKFDSRKMSNDNVAIPEIFTVVDNEQLVINGYNQLPMDVEIPIGFKTGQTGNFTLKANEIKNLDANTALVVKDKVLNLEYDLTNGDAYEFNSAAANGTNRFSIIFRTAGVTTSIDNSKLNTSTNVFANANGELVVKTSAPLSADAKVSVYNAVGQLISIKPLSSGMTIANAARAAGVYWVKITNDGEMVTRKVIVN